MSPEDLAELKAGMTVVAVVETTVFGVSAYHSTCSRCPGWRCHREAHDQEDTALRCANRHSGRHA